MEQGLPFGIGPSSGGPRRFTRPELIAVGVLVVLVLGVVAGFAVAGRPATATRAAVFGGSVVIDDSVGGPVVVDVADGHPTLRLTGVAAQVGAANEAQVAAVAVGDGTLLVNRVTGTVNFVGPDQLVVAPKGAGVALPGPPDAALANVYVSGRQAFVTRQGPTATTVSLVSQATVDVAALIETDATTTSSASAAQRVPVATAAIGPLLGGAGTAVAVGDSLWSLVRTGPRTARVVEVTEDATGRALSVHDRGPVFSLSAASGSPGAGAALDVSRLANRAGHGSTTMVAAATARSIRLFRVQRSGQVATLANQHWRGIGPVAAIVPVGRASGGPLFAVHSRSRWYLVGFAGPTGHQTRPVAVSGAGTGVSEADATLLTPVVDGNTIFTLVQPTPGGRPIMVRIDRRGGRASVQPVGTDPGGVYPLVGPAEEPSWADEQILVDGPRVLINNPDSELAVIVFTDQADRAIAVDKGSAVDINPSAPPGDQVLPSSSTPSSTPRTATQPAPPAAPAVDPALACKTSAQKPNVPQLAPPHPATHTVALSWTYPLIDPEDCEPSSYTVTATALGGAPQPSPSAVTVTGETSVVFSGLLSSTTYRFVVTAYIDTQATSSEPVDVTTNAEGPNSPGSVVAAANGTTGWQVTWQPCSGTCPSTEPVAAYTVTASACAGSFVGQVPAVQVGAGQDSVTVPFTAAPGLLGASLEFTVQPIGANGLLGDPSPPSSCVEGWESPDASAITLDAAEPSARPGNTTATLTVTPTPGLTNVAIYGSDTTDFVFSVGGQTQGPTTSPHATFSGLQPGGSYPTKVTVYPAGFPQGAVVVDGPILAPTVPWPSDLAMSVAAHIQSFLAGSVTATITDAYGDVPAGVSVSVQASGSILCGNESTPVPATAVEQVAGGTDGTVTIGLSAVSGELGEQCTLQLSLSEATTDVHGGPSPVLTGTFDTGAPGGFTVSWRNAPVFPYTAPSNVLVKASGLGSAVSRWTATVVAPAGCSATGQATPGETTVTLTVTSCVTSAVQTMETSGQASAPFDVVVQVTWSGLAGVGAGSEQLPLPAETLSESQPSGSSGSPSSGSSSGSSGSSGSQPSGSSSGSSSALALSAPVSSTPTTEGAL